MERTILDYIKEKKQRGKWGTIRGKRKTREISVPKSLAFEKVHYLGFPPAPARSWYIFVSLVFCLSIMISFPNSLMSSRHIFSQDIQKVLPVLSSILPLFSPSGLPSPTAPWTSGLGSPLACLCVQFHVSWMMRHPLFEVVPSFQGFVGLLPPTVRLPITC